MVVEIDMDRDERDDGAQVVRPRAVDLDRVGDAGAARGAEAAPHVDFLVGEDRLDELDLGLRRWKSGRWSEGQAGSAFAARRYSVMPISA
jgi:hypothetical protein